MTTLLLSVYIMVAVSMIVIILLQRSEGGALGMGGGGNFMSGRGAANLLTRVTGILGAIFFILSLTLSVLNHKTTPESAVDLGGKGQPAATAPVTPPAAQPAIPEGAERATGDTNSLKLNRSGATSPATTPPAAGTPATSEVKPAPAPKAQIPQSQ